MDQGSDDSTHFGFQTVSEREKRERVSGVFTSVADNYDVMNDVMSFGMHRLWKRIAIVEAGLRPGARVLDLAGGTGDMARLALSAMRGDGEVVVADYNAEMLARGRDLLADAGCSASCRYARVNAEKLAFRPGNFDCVIMSFGLRNVTRIADALCSIREVIKPGGRLVVLEFSKLRLHALQAAYDAYSFQVLPKMGKMIANDAESYQYLAESIRMHPEQETLLEMFREAGFERCDFKNLAGGIVAIHRGFRL
jgi:demethylmenaquinone methyltransferase/2-methoxy-6-polyprenyl-1,4-benzoquinol methylase